MSTNYSKEILMWKEPGYQKIRKCLDNDMGPITFSRQDHGTSRPGHWLQQVYSCLLTPFPEKRVIGQILGQSDIEEKCLARRVQVGS